MCKLPLNGYENGGAMAVTPDKDLMRDLLLIFSSGSLTFLGSWFLEWFKKKKKKTQEVVEITSSISTAAKESVDTVATVIGILDERLEKEREYFTSKIEEK